MTEATVDDLYPVDPERSDVVDRLAKLLASLDATRSTVDAGPLTSAPDVAHGEIRDLIDATLGRLASQESELSELRRREVASQALYERYVDLFEFAPVGYLVLDGLGYVSQANLTLARMLGVVPSRLKGSGFADFVAPESQEAYRLHREALCATALPRVGNLVLRRVDNTRITVQIDGQPVTGPNGRVAWCRMAFSDITERMAALAALKQSEQRLKRAHDVARLGYWDWDPLADVVTWSEGAAAIFGRDLGSLAPTLEAVDAMVHPEDRERHIVERSRLLLQAGRVDLSYRIIRPDGSVCHIQEVAEIVRDADGQVERVSGTIQDVTDTRQNELALSATNARLTAALAELESAQARLVVQERLAAVGQLSAGVAHDFNNILASILLYSEILQRTEGLDSSSRERMAVIADEARRGAALVQQVLDFGRRAMLERMPTDLAAFVEGVEGLLRHVLPESVLVEVAAAGRTVDTTISADPARLQQALINLATNSRDAMPQGGTLRLGVTRTPPNTPVMCAACAQEFSGEWVVLSVSDTGVGIAPQDLPHIFEPFFTTRRPIGHGLGLPQVLGIVEQQGGHITVESRLGQGTTFRLYFPVLAPVSVQIHAQPGLELALGGGQSILVVEDNDAIRQALLDVLEMLGYRPHAAVDGRQALAMLLEEGDATALVVSDWIMPVMGGEALVSAMREHGLTVPVLMITGHPVTPGSVQSTPDGVVGWVQKPITLERLSAAIGSALDPANLGRLSP